MYRKLFHRPPYKNKWCLGANVLEECGSLVFSCLARCPYIFSCRCPLWFSSLLDFLQKVSHCCCNQHGTSFSCFLSLCKSKWLRFNQHEYLSRGGSVACALSTLRSTFFVSTKNKCFATLSDGWPRSADWPGFTHSSTAKWWAFSSVVIIWVTLYLVPFDSDRKPTWLFPTVLCSKIGG